MKTQQWVLSICFIFSADCTGSRGMDEKGDVEGGAVDLIDGQGCYLCLPPDIVALSLLQRVGKIKEAIVKS